LPKSLLEWKCSIQPRSLHWMTMRHPTDHYIAYAVDAENSNQSFPQAGSTV